MITNKLFENRTSFSFEIFPPKKTSPIETIYDTLDELKDLSPDFISVTYGAGGSENCSTTLSIAQRIKEVCKVESVVHLPCMHLTKDDASSILNQFEDAGIENILALRGDRIEGREPKQDFLHASDLIKFINKSNKKFHISGACYPEGHPACQSFQDDIKHLKEKVDCGANHLISQLFFDNSCFYYFLDEARKQGISVPIEAGIMPVVNKKQIARMVNTCGVILPSKYRIMMEKYSNNEEALRDAGIAYAINQIVDLISHGVDGIHLYTMNKPYVARKISEGIKNLLKATN